MPELTLAQSAVLGYGLWTGSLFVLLHELYVKPLRRERGY